MSAVLRQSGPKFYREGVLITPRAMIAKCEECGKEHAPFGFRDSQGQRTFFCADHNPDRKEKGQGQ